MGRPGVSAGVEACGKLLQNRKLTSGFLNPVFVRAAAAKQFNLHVNELLLKTITKSIILFYSIFVSHHLSNLPLKRMEFKRANKPVLNLLFKWVNMPQLSNSWFVYCQCEKVWYECLEIFPGVSPDSSEPILCPSPTPGLPSHSSTLLL